MTVFSKPVVSRHNLKVPVLVTLALLVLARSRVTALAKLTQVGPLRSDSASPEELKKAKQQLYYDEPDGTKTVLLPFRGRVSKVSPLLP
jgi:ATP-binding cassette, subfamily D (ALD), peroxisomal long-chain fatty acid import protein